MSTTHQQDPTLQAAKGGHAKTIIVNARAYEIDAKELSYEDVVNLAYNNNPPSGENVIITVTYTRGEHGKEGSMLPGDRVKVNNKMVFDVSATDRS
jgi:hypothetical protein